ncbi:MAG: amidohydrolase family protein [Spirochaetales bacterium]|nr:amidohydrolase family protein [Spirochaetales bacterium]
MNESFELTGVWVYTGKGVSLSIRGERVVAVRPCPLPPGAPYLSPGFLDGQVNGYAGMDYNAPQLDPKHVAGIVAVLAASGTTRHLPTFVTAPGEKIRAGLRTLSLALETDPQLAAAVPGVHIEGPYICAEDGPRGAHDARYVRDPDFGEFMSWQEAAGGRIRIVTLAPERKGALEFIERVSGQGVIAAIGHCACAPERVREAVEAGALLSTHLGNGSHPLIPRLRNYIWEQLAEDRLWAGIIADGFHLPPAVLKVFLRVKGLGRLLLVSDAAALGGHRPGLHKWGAIDVQVFEDGHLGVAGTEILAGAGHLLDRGVAQFVRATGCSIGEAVRLCTLNPARLLGAPEQPSSADPTPGMAADLVQFRWSPGAEALVVDKTLFRGRLAYARSPGPE